MSPLSISHVYRQIPTTLEINGPILSFDAYADYGVTGAVQPTGLSTCNAGVGTFIGIATAVWPSQSPTNYPKNTGSISYQWYEVGGGALSDGTNITGSATTTLTVSNLTNPSDNGRNFFVRANYIPSAYGVGKSTANAVNDPLDSNSAGVSVYPTITVTNQPGIATAALTLPAEFQVYGETSDSSALTYRWMMNGSDLTDGSTVTGAGTTILSVSSDTVGINTIQNRITHPTSCNSPVYSSVVDFEVVDPRQMVIFEEYPNGTSSANIIEVNLFDGEYSVVNQNNAQLMGFYASEKDLEVELEIHAAKGIDQGGYTGGQGGVSIFRFTMLKDVEHVVAGFSLNKQTTTFIYRQASILAVIGAGGDAGTSGNGGRGGGIGIPGENGSGQGQGGAGGSTITAGTLTNSGATLGSAWGGGYPGFCSPLGFCKAPVPQGGQIAACPYGGYYNLQGYSPCQLLGNSQFRMANGTLMTNSATIARGFKAGGGIRNVEGWGDNGAFGGGGVRGGAGGLGGAGGGGGSGYQDGSVTVVSSTQGGSTATGSTFIIRMVD